MHNAAERPSFRLRAGLLMPFALSAMGCAGTLRPTPPAAPTIPLPPAVTEPPPSGSYWTEHCKLLSEVRALLKSTPPTSERCSIPGP